MTNVYPMRVGERTLHRATVAFLRANLERRSLVDRLYHLLVEAGVTDADGKPALFTANDAQRRVIYRWLTKHTGTG